MERLAFEFPKLPITEQLAMDVIQELSSRGIAVAMAEGCTGGALSDALTVPGATRAVHFGGVFYSRESKIDLLGIPEQLIVEYGEYSPQIALSMATNIRRKRGDSLGIATVGRIDSVTHIGYSMKGYEPLVISLLTASSSRAQQKNEVVVQSLSQALLYLRGAKNMKGQTIPLGISETGSIKDPVRTEQFVALARKMKMRVGTIESCTGGAVANAITDVEGAGDVFDIGYVAYDEDVKRMLGVSLETMAFGGVYSERVAIAMAEALLVNSSVNVAIATTGLMDTMDTRPYHNHTKPGTIYASIALRGQVPWVTTICLPCGLYTTRSSMKREVVRIILAQAHELLMAFGKPLQLSRLNEYQQRGVLLPFPV